MSTGGDLPEDGKGSRTSESEKKPKKPASEQASTGGDLPEDGKGS